jgi:hypothetical protein
MEMLRISGRTYPARPRSKGFSVDKSRRLRSIVQALSFAAQECSETERRLYKSILEVHAHAANLLDQLKGETLPEPTLGDLVSEPHAL